MDRTTVSSSNIRSIGYDHASSVLEIEFLKGGVYQYAGVQQAEFDGLMSAASKGTYFNANIKRRYAEAKL